MLFRAEELIPTNVQLEINLVLPAEIAGLKGPVIGFVGLIVPHLRRGRLLVQRRPQLVIACFELIEEARIFHGHDRLMREGFQRRDLALATDRGALASSGWVSRWRPGGGIAAPDERWRICAPPGNFTAGVRNDVLEQQNSACCPYGWPRRQLRDGTWLLHDVPFHCAANVMKSGDLRPPPPASQKPADGHEIPCK